MRIIVVGSGPTGLTLGAALARRGHHVVSIDRDPGPPTGGAWGRRGVKQFDHAHGFRPQVRDVLSAEWPEAYDRWIGLGGEAIPFDIPGVDAPLVIMRSRRSTYERALRAAAAEVTGLTLHTGHVGGLLERSERVVGAVVDGRAIEADLVIDASGRTSQITDSQGEVLGADCGIAYVNRSYRRHEGTELGPLTTVVAWGGSFDGFHAMVFPHDHRYFSVVLVRPTTDAGLRQLLHREAFEAACRAIPAVAEWTDPSRSEPSGDVLPGVHLRNAYRHQSHLPGLVAVGDSVATTAPTAGRGMALASMQIEALLRLLDGGADLVTIAEPFGIWCDAQVRPWVEDHLATDGETVRRWHGADIDLTRPLTSTAILDAAPAEPRIVPYIGGYASMTALPASLAPAEPLARAVYRSGWRPQLAEGPTRHKLVALLDDLGLRGGRDRTRTCDLCRVKAAL